MHPSYECSSLTDLFSWIPRKKHTPFRSNSPWNSTHRPESPVTVKEVTCGCPWPWDSWKALCITRTLGMLLHQYIPIHHSDKGEKISETYHELRFQWELRQNIHSIPQTTSLLKYLQLGTRFFQTKSGIILSHKPFHKTMLMGSLAPLFLAIMDEWEEKNLELQVDMRISWMVQIIIFVIKKYTVIPVMSFLLTEPYLPVFTFIGRFTSLLAVQSTYHHRRPICS